MAITKQHVARRVGRELAGGGEVEDAPVRPEATSGEEVIPEHLDTLRAVAHGRRLQAQAMGRAVKRGVERLKAAARGIAAVWRRSREESHAVSTLRRLDDRMLRDIGIGHRSQIVSAVRSMGTDAPAPTAPAAVPPVVSVESPSAPAREREEPKAA